MLRARENKGGHAAVACLLTVLTCALALWGHPFLTAALAADDAFAQQPNSTFFTTQGQGEMTAELSAVVNMEGLDGVELSYQWYSNPSMSSEKGTPVQGARGTVAADGGIAATLDSSFADGNGGVGWYYAEVIATAGTASYTFTSDCVACATSVGALSSLVLGMLEDAYEDRMTDQAKYNASNWKKVETTYNDATAAIVAAAAAAKPDADAIVTAMSAAIADMAAVEQGGFDVVNEDDGTGNQGISGGSGTSSKTSGLKKEKKTSKNKKTSTKKVSTKEDSTKKNSSKKSSSGSSSGSALSSTGSALSSSSSSLSSSSGSSLSSSSSPLKKNTSSKKDSDDGDSLTVASAVDGGADSGDGDDPGSNQPQDETPNVQAESQETDSGNWFSEHAVPLSLVVLAMLAAICAAVWRISRTRNAAAITAEDEAFAGDNASVAAAAFDGMAMRAPISDAPVIEF